MSAEQHGAVRYWLRRAEESLGEADILARAGHWNACVNRLYYACFYAVTALFRQRGLSASKHSGVRGLLNRELVRPGTIPESLGTLYNDLYENRHEADYVDFVDLDESQVRPWLAEARTFVQQIAHLLNLPPEGPNHA